jgi:hypothetical protein
MQQQPPAPPPGVQLPPGYEIKKKGHGLRNLGIGCAGLIVGAIVIAIIASAASNSSSSNNTANNNPAASTPSAKTTPTKATTPKVLFDKSGSGISKTAIFNTPSEWQIDYSFDCTNFGSQGNFSVIVYDGKSETKDVPINALAAKGQDTVYEHNLSGPYYLDINSECDWHVTVKG